VGSWQLGTLRKSEKSHFLYPPQGTRGGTVGLGTALQSGRSRVPLVFFSDTILPAELRSWGDSVTNTNDYQEYSLGTSTSWNPQGVSRLVMKLLTFVPNKGLFRIRTGTSESLELVINLPPLHLSSFPPLPTLWLDCLSFVTEWRHVNRSWLRSTVGWIEGESIR